VELALLIFRLFLAGVFATSASAKLADFAGSKKAAADFGVPASLTTVFAIALIAAEFAVALLLLSTATSWYGAIGAAVLLAVFTAGMVYQIAQGRAPDCHCFGQIKSEPVGVASVVRNLVLFVPAAVLLYHGRSGQGLAITSLDRSSVQMILLIVLVLLGAAAIDYLRRILKRQDELARRIDVLEVLGAEGGTVNREDAGSPFDGLPIGAVLPDFSVTAVDGSVVRTPELISGRPALLFFVSPTCEPCAALLPRIREWRDGLRDAVDIVLISYDDAAKNVAKFGDVAPLYLDENRRFAKAVSARWTPSAMLVAADGRVGSHVAAGDVATIELVSQTIANVESGRFTPILLPGERFAPQRVKIGDPVPEINLESMRGERVTSEGLKGARTMFMFWGLECPHCVAMTEDLRAWETSKNGESPELIVFSDAEANLASPVIVDPEYTVAATLGMHGTPSAVLVDEEGRFASEVAVGAPQIWALVGHNPNK
jgi:thiol-disulfide isomerase/thioredoxin